MKFCPSCRGEWPPERETCPRCLTALVDDLAASVRCPNCGREWPAYMQTCRHCLSLLRPDPAAAAEAAQDLLAAGVHPWRPDGRPPFRDDPSCTLQRLSARGGLVFIGPDEFVEAEIDGPGGVAMPPLTCRDVDGAVLFVLDRYDPVEDGLVAVAADGAPLATYVKADGAIDVRDETSAPVAALRPTRGGYELVETGGRALATCGTKDVELEGWVDDQWWLSVGPGPLPLKPLAAVAMVLATKVLFGRASPGRVGDDDDPDGGGGRFRQSSSDSVLDLIRPQPTTWPYRL